MTIEAPEWRVDRWFNTDGALDVHDFRGRVVVLHAFQMLCPGCVLHGIPQAQRIAEHFDRRDVAVIGLHTVFEHHAAMGEVALEAFLHEYRVRFPVGVDRPGEGSPIPQTMRAYEMRGTPSLVVIDRGGHVRAHLFGRPSDLQVGAEVQRWVDEAAPSAVCDSEGCAIPANR
ncbi:MAG: redoxin domain-containing protein [Myxococcota bacterium]